MDDKSATHRMVDRTAFSNAVALFTHCCADLTVASATELLKTALLAWRDAPDTVEGENDPVEDEEGDVEEEEHHSACDHEAQIGTAASLYSPTADALLRHCAEAEELHHEAIGEHCAEAEEVQHEAIGEECSIANPTDAGTSACGFPPAGFRLVPESSDHLWEFFRC